MQNTFLSVLSSAINASLYLDPDSTHRLQALQDKVVRVELLPINLIFTCEFKNNGLHLTTDDTKVADTTLRGTPFQILGMAILKKDRQRFFAEDLEMIGDAEVGQQVTALFDELDIDWQEHASKMIGDIATHQLANFTKGALNWLKQAESTLTQDTADFIHEEVSWFPTKLALQDFFNDIDTLRMDTDRVAIKIDHLRQQLLKDELSK